MRLRYRGPRAFCDRCDSEFYHHELKRQWVEADDHLVDSGWLVCPKCWDRTDLPRRSKQRFGDPTPIFPPGMSKRD